MEKSQSELSIPMGCKLVFESDAQHFLCTFPFSKPFFDDFKNYIVCRYNDKSKWWRVSTDDFYAVIDIMNEHFGGNDGLCANNYSNGN